MWAQIITMTLKPGEEGRVDSLFEQLHAAEQSDSPLRLTLGMRDQDDPTKLHTLVLFDSEEKAREREQDPARNELLKPMRAFMAEMIVGPPEFINADVIWNEAR